MELIANLGQTKTANGLTAENLQNLEKIFHNAVGDKQEIDLESFKKIVQSKNMFFVERIFHVFDADRSGTVSLEEFMQVMRCFASQSPAEKLKYLFDVYDLNGDGHIQQSELRSVISECMKENGLHFEDAETDELTRMLFEDADTDGSGLVTFEEFKSQLERQPAFLENLTLSIERWLLPPMVSKSSPPCNFMCLKKVTWKHIRNNWTSVVYLLIYLLLNLVIFTSRAYQYSESNSYVIIARACGQCLNFNCTFLVVLVLRQTLTWLRTHGYSQYFPIDHHLYYHKFTGCVVLFFSLLHTAAHIANFSIVSREKDMSLHEVLTSTHLGIGWVGGSACLTGWILLTLLLIMCVSAMPFVRRSGKFEVFYCLHLLAFPFWVVLILHGQNFWKWFLAPAVLWFLEWAIRVNRNLSSGKLAYVQQGVLLPSKVTHLVIKRPPKFDFRPGDYVYINIPSIARFEWHPFTISSAPELDDVLWVHIRGVGEWTNSLYNYFKKEDRNAVLSDELVKSMENIPHILKTDASTSGGGDSLARTTTLLTPRLENSLRSIPNAKISSSTFTCPSPDPKCKKLSVSSSISGRTFTCPSPDPTHKKFSVSSSTNSALCESFVNPSFSSDDSLNQTVIEMERGNRTFSISNRASVTSGQSAVDRFWRRISLASTSTSKKPAHQHRRDLRVTMSEHNGFPDNQDDVFSNYSRRSRRSMKEKRPSVRVSVAKRGLRRCQTVIVMPTVNEDDEEEIKVDLEQDVFKTDEELKEAAHEVEEENIIVRPQPLKIFLDGPYGSPTRHIFHARHAVLIATGIGVTPFASILQSIMYQYRKSKHTCPNCNHKWSDPMPVSSIRLKKVDFFWLNRDQRAFEWFVNLLSELEVEQAQLKETDRFLDIHMYITSALLRTDMKAVGLQMALDLLYKKEKRDLITGLKSRTLPGRPDWNKVFTSIAEQQKGKVTVFFCGPNELAKALQTKCDEFGFRFRKEIF